MPKGKKKDARRRGQAYEHRRTEVVSSSDEEDDYFYGHPAPPPGIDEEASRIWDDPIRYRHGVSVSNGRHGQGKKSGNRVVKITKVSRDDISIYRKKKKAIEQEKLEEKLLEVLDGLSAKSHVVRTTAMGTLRSALMRRSFDSVLSNHRATLADQLARALKRGRDAEIKAAAALTPLLSLQIGDDGVVDFTTQVRPAIMTTIANKSISMETRIQCCKTLSFICLVLEDDVFVLQEVLALYESIFSVCYPKEDTDGKLAFPDMKECGSLYAAALDAWSLVQGLLQPEHVLRLLHSTPPGLTRLCDMLDAPSPLVARSAALVLVASYEMCMEVRGVEEQLAPGVELVLEKTEDFLKASHHQLNKQQRKEMRILFRDIHQYLEMQGSGPLTSAQLGPHEVQWEGWGGAAVYATLMAHIGNGAHVLVRSSNRLRAVLQLPPLAPDYEETPVVLQKKFKVKIRQQNEVTRTRMRTHDRAAKRLMILA